MEIWKAVKGYEGYYEASNFGNIRGVNRVISTGKGTVKCEIGKKINKLSMDKGYLRVYLSMNGKRKGFLVHRIVAQAFIDNNNIEKNQVNHIDGDKTNNCVENLEWVSNNENSIHKQKNALFASKLSIDNVLEIRRLKEFHSYTELSKMFGVSRDAIISIIKRKSWKFI